MGYKYQILYICISKLFDCSAVFFLITCSLDKNPQEIIAKVNELQKKLESMREYIEKLPGIDLSKEEQERQMEVLRQQLITKTELLKKYKNFDMFEVP